MKEIKSLSPMHSNSEYLEYNDHTFFDAILKPNRSLSLNGFVILIILSSIATLGLGSYFLVAGAWPIFGFLGLDFLLLFLAFKINYRSGKIHERIKITRDCVVVYRREMNGFQREIHFNPYWLKVTIDNVKSNQFQIILSSHRDKVTIGDFLSNEEKIEFANSLKSALSRAKNNI
tara:strand:- start:131302 stop:131826 length:525 start_codon:yes stop_codon:yes gene_type:complete